MQVSYFLKIEKDNIQFSNLTRTCKEWFLEFQIYKLLENQTACSFSKQATLFWSENTETLDSDKRDYLQKEHIVN